MKLSRLNIPEYRVLREIDINFKRGEDRNRLLYPHRRYSLDFFAGVNGTGKSTVLRLLGKLFATLQTQDYSFLTPIELIYSIEVGGSERRVTVTNLNNDEDGSPRFFPTLRHKIDDEAGWRTEQIRPEFLPQQVVIYTTGIEDIWNEELEGLSEKVEIGQPIDISDANEDQLYLHELPGHWPSTPSDDQEFEYDPDAPLLFIENTRLPLIALCGLIASTKGQNGDEPEVLSPALVSIGLETMQGFSLRLRTQRSLTPIRQQEVVDRLISIADQVVVSGSDHLLLFNVERQINPPEGRQSIFSIYGSTIELFQHLNMLYEHRPFYDQPLREVNIFLKRKQEEQEDQPEEAQDNNLAMLHLFEWLSDGEQSFLARMALFTLFRADNLLIILDEPEVHFNDVWKREIVNMLNNIMHNCNSHAVIATHSSIALSDVPPQDILVFHRQEQFVRGKDAIRGPGIETFGADPSDILVHVFGTRFASGEHSSRYIQREIGERNTTEDLMELESYVAPGYWRYRIHLEAQRLQRLHA